MYFRISKYTFNWIDQIPSLVFIRIFVPFLFQNETELEKSQFCTFITKKSLWSSVVHHHTLFCNSVICAADFKVSLMYFPGTGVSDQHGRDWVRASQRDLLQCQRLEHSCQCHPSGVISVYFHQESHLLGDPSHVSSWLCWEKIILPNGRLSKLAFFICRTLLSSSSASSWSPTTSWSRAWTSSARWRTPSLSRYRSTQSHIV